MYIDEGTINLKNNNNRFQLEMVYSQPVLTTTSEQWPPVNNNQFKSPSQLNLPRNLLHILDQPLKNDHFLGSQRKL
jgi:hypothetical protein